LIVTLPIPRVSRAEGPKPNANGTEPKGAFTLALDGALTGAVETSHSGTEGADLRMILKYSDEKERRE
jgi:hypothetical protein